MLFWPYECPQYSWAQNAFGDCDHGDSGDLLRSVVKLSFVANKKPAGNNPAGQENLPGGQNLKVSPKRTMRLPRALPITSLLTLGSPKPTNGACWLLVRPTSSMLGSMLWKLG